MQTKSIKHRPKRKAPTAPLPSGRFVLKPSATTHEYNKDNHNIENIDDENINKNCLSSTEVFMNKKVKIMNSDELEDNLKPRNNVPIPTPQKELHLLHITIKIVFRVVYIITKMIIHWEQHQFLFIIQIKKSIRH